MRSSFRTSIVGTVATVSALALLSSCGDSNSSSDTTGAGSTTSNALPQGAEPVQLDPADFTADITHPYFPMTPGTRWTYEEVEPDGSVQRVVLIATDQTKQLANGITARVVRDTVSADGEIIEDTTDWYAQDSAGNVWYMGEDTAEFDQGEIATKEGSWEAGVDGAQPGILLPADPQPGMAYRQEYYKGHAEDHAAILSHDEMAETPYGHFTDVVLTKDLVGLEPEVLEYKLYAKNVGLVLSIHVSGGSGREELVSVDQAPAGAGTGPLGNPNA
jgi:hypothetical protein